MLKLVRTHKYIHTCTRICDRGYAYIHTKAAVGVAITT